MIDWISEKNEVLFNPRTPAALKNSLLLGIDQLEHLKSHVCFATSGSTGNIKWVALSKEGMLASAKAVNVHLESDDRDIWLNPLPVFHVGGAGISARGYLSRSKVVPCVFSKAKWSPQEFVVQLEANKVTLTALVPTQIFDLVSLGIKPPHSLRAVIVGGGALSETVYFAAIKLGWKILPSYGLTECASQVATAECGSWSNSVYPLLKPLEHVELALQEEGYLKIKSSSLLTAYVNQSADTFTLYDPKVGGWLTTEDKVVFNEKSIQSICRGENFVKIGGESVDLLRLEKIFDEVKLSSNMKQDMALVAVKNQRLGHCLHLAIAGPLSCDITEFVECYHQKVFPFERIQHIHSVSEIPRSYLNKILKDQLIVSLKLS